MKVKVNDVELELEPGTSAIDAVFAAGYDVPYFCSQEYMSPIGACRMCLAKVGSPRKDRATGEWLLDEATGEIKIFYFPNPMATCTTMISEGMIIDTLCDEAQKAQKGMVEMTLINHPLDCPTCDKGGACELQDRAYEYGSGLSRFAFDKRHQEKHHALSPLITLDRERCIHCKRCVRYFEEVPGDKVLDFIERGGHTYIGTLDEGLPSNFTGNITDICPVGALLDASSRFRGRNWEYHHTRTTSLDDSSGSAIMIDARTGRIERIKAALHPDINKTWIDDGIRFGHEYADSSERIRTPLVRKGGDLSPVSWEEASLYIKQKLFSLAEKEVGVILRADATLEEGVAAKSLAKHLQTGQLDHYPRGNASVISPVAASLNDVATANAILVIGDVTEEVPAVDLRIKDALKGVTPPELLPHGVPIADLRLKERMPRKKEILSVAAPYQVDLMKYAGYTLSYQAGQEAALLENLQSLVEDEKGTSEEHALVQRLKEAKNAVIIYGGFVLASQAATQAANAFAKSVGAKLMILGPMANSYGLESLGVLPSHDRYSYHEMLKGSAKALVISGLNPALDTEAREKLADLELLVVHDLFHNETTELADVVLPAKSAYEKEGTVVNLEGRYLPVKAAPVDNGLAEDFTGVVKHLGEVLGERLEGRSLRSSRRVLRKWLEFDLATLPPEGAFIKAKHRSITPTRAKLALPKGDVLVHPSMLRFAYLAHNSHLHKAHGEIRLQLHPQDAAKHDLSQGDRVRLKVAGLERKAQVAITKRVPEGLMLLPALPEQRCGLVEADMTSLIKTEALEVA